MKNSIERKDKKLPTGVPGIFVNVFHRRDRIALYRLQFNAIGKLHTVYVGTINTWKSRYNDKLELARKRRDDLWSTGVSQ